MQVAYTNLKQKEYILFYLHKEISVKQRNEDKKLELVINYDKEYTFQSLAPITFCHYDAWRKYLLIGNIFGEVQIYKAEERLKIVKTFYLKKQIQPSYSNAILFIDTNNTQTFIFTKRELFIYQNLDNTNDCQQIQLCGQLISMARIPHKHISVVSFEDCDAPLLVSPQSYKDLNLLNNKILKVEGNTDKVADPIRYSNLKANENTIIVLEETNQMQQRVTLYRVPQNTENIKCSKLSRMSKVVSFKISYQIIDFVIKNKQFLLFGPDRYQLMSIKDKNVVQYQSLKGDKMKIIEKKVQKLS